jgi:hypothetical protein
MTPASHRFWRGFECGLLGTLAMTIIMLMVWGATSRVMPEPVPLALVSRLIARAVGSDHVGAFAIVASVPIFLAYGAFWMGLLAISLDRVTWYDGLAVGLGLWLVMAVFLVPIAGGYTFSLATSGGMWLSTFIEHVVYGLTAGVLIDHRLRTPHHAR